MDQHNTELYISLVPNCGVYETNSCLLVSLKTSADTITPKPYADATNTGLQKGEKHNISLTRRQKQGR